MYSFHVHLQVSRSQQEVSGNHTVQYTAEGDIDVDKRVTM